MMAEDSGNTELEVHQVRDGVGMSIKQDLRVSSTFQSVPEDDLELVVPACREEVASKDAPIFKQGDAARSLYIVSEGRVSLHITLERPEGGSQCRTSGKFGGPLWFDPTKAPLGPQQWN
jgi:hypothetical protein